MTFLDFEQPIADIYERLEQLREIGTSENIDMSNAIRELEGKLEQTKIKTYQNLTAWQKVQLSRHPERPYTLFYLENMCEHFTELHGDRNFGDDKAIVGGFGNLDGQTIMFIGQQKGKDTKSRQYRNFGMANPEGYRKALRLIKLAERFDKPIVCLIDTPGAYPGIEAEQRGQAEAIARNLFEMAQLTVPVVCVIIGEGASGGALGIGMGNRILMLENTWYSVISPESCSSILWRSWDYKQKAAEELKLTAENMKHFNLIDEIVPEPLGGAHHSPLKMVATVKSYIQKHLAELKKMNSDELVKHRIDKFSAMGEYVVKK
ncbi:MAG: acetyl-CoA carboxylase carboxyltransferase subunit alpha [Chitinophagales bacterium]